MPAGRIIVGTDFQALRRSAFEWLDANTRDSPNSARFIEQTNYQHEAVQSAWNKEYNGLRITISDLTTFGIELHEYLFGPYPDLDTLRRRTILEQAVSELDSDTFANPQYFTAAFSELISELESQGVTDSVSLEQYLADTDSPSANQSVLQTVYTSYSNLIQNLAHNDTRRNNSKLQEVSQSEQSLQTALPALDAIVVSGCIDPSPVELAFIDRLVQEFPVCIILPILSMDTTTSRIDGTVRDTIDAFRERGFELQEAVSQKNPFHTVAQQLYHSTETSGEPPAGLTWAEAYTPDREVRHLARQIRLELSSTEHTAEDILVVAPGLLSYRDAITDIFSGAEIPHSYHVSILLERTYVGQAVLDCIALCDHPQADRLSHLLNNPLVNPPGIDNSEVADIQRRLYTADIGTFSDELTHSNAGVSSILEKLTAVQTASATTIVETFTSLLDHLNLESTLDSVDTHRSLDAGYESRAFQRAVKILDTVDSVWSSLTVDEPLVELRTAFEGVRVSSPSQIPDGHVEIIGLDDTPMASFSLLYILGATDDFLAGREQRPRYFQRLGEQFDLFEPDTSRNRDRYRFGMILANAERVHMTTPAATPADDPLLPSPFIEELARITGLQPVPVELESIATSEDLQREMAGHAPAQLEPALEAASSNGALDSSACSNALRGAVLAENRAQATLTVHDGQLSSDALESLDSRLTAEPYSNSRLSTYAKCGFKYLLSEGWGFDYPDAIEPSISPLTVGNIIHDIVEAFFVKLQNAPGSPVDLTTYDQEFLERELLRLALNRLADEQGTQENVFMSNLCDRLLAGLAIPAENPYFAPDLESLDTPDGTFKQFLEIECERAADGYRPIVFEASFGNGDGIPIGDGALPVTGIIDRVDVTPDGLTTVLDYKSSRVSSVRRREQNVLDGIDFQLPLYMLGHNTVDEIDRSRDIQGRYYILNDEPTASIRRPLTDRFSDIDFAEFLHTTVPSWVSGVIEALTEGAFHPAVIGAQAAQCDYCDFKEVCDVRHHRRFDIVGAIETASSPAYIPRSARPDKDPTDLQRRDSDV